MKKTDNELSNITILLQLTNKCKNKCVQCYTKSGRKEKNELNFSEINSFADTLKKKYQNKQITICLSGGEPTLREDFGEIVLLFCRNKIFKVMINSCGGNIEKYADLINKYKIRVVSTLYGNEKTHDRIAGREGAFNDVIIAHKLCNSFVIFLVFKDSLEGSRDVIKTLDDLKIKTTVLARPVNIGRGKNIPLALNADLKELKKIIKKTGREICWKDDQTIDEVNHDCDGIFCPVSKPKIFIITSIGNVYFGCCFASDKEKIFNKLFLGNILTDQWGEILLRSKKLNSKMSFTKTEEWIRKNNIKFHHPQDRCNYCLKFGGPDIQ